MDLYAICFGLLDSCKTWTKIRGKYFADGGRHIAAAKNSYKTCMMVCIWDTTCTGIDHRGDSDDPGCTLHTASSRDETTADDVDEVVHYALNRNCLPTNTSTDYK